jgi:hypothetical protein
MKTYTAPALAAKGNVVDLTQINKSGSDDTFVANTGLGFAPGNVGFLL